MRYNGLNAHAEQSIHTTESITYMSVVLVKVGTQCMMYLKFVTPIIYINKYALKKSILWKHQMPLCNPKMVFESLIDINKKTIILSYEETL